MNQKAEETHMNKMDDNKYDLYFQLQDPIIEEDIEYLKHLDFSFSDILGPTKMNLMQYYIYVNDIRKPPELFINLFLNKGIDINHKDENGLSALHFTVSCNQINICQYLLKKGADVNIVNNAGNSPLWRAVMDFRGESIKKKMIMVLLENGADMNLENNYGNSPRAIIMQTASGIDDGINPKEWDLRDIL